MTERWKSVEDCEGCCLRGPIEFDVESGKGSLGCQMTNTPENVLRNCLRNGPFTRLREVVGKGSLTQEKPVLVLLAGNKA